MSLPATITVSVNGVLCTAAGKPNQAGTGVWFKGSTMVPEVLEADGVTDFAAVDAALGSITVSQDGSALKAGEVHTSAPRLYSRTHAKSGQAIPGSGGKRSVTHSKALLLGSGSEAVRYTLMVTVTYIEHEGFATTVKATRQAVGMPLDAPGLSFLKVAA